MKRTYRSLTTAALAVTVAVVLVITLWPMPGASRAPGAIYGAIHRAREEGAPSVITWASVESFSNVLLFVPIGVFLAMLLPRTRWWIAVMAGLLLTTAIELTQHFLPIGRTATLSDVIANTSGAAIGALGALLVRTLWAKRTGGHPAAGRASAR